MATGRYFQALTAFDLLGVLLPGVFALAMFVSILPSQPFPSSTGGVLFFTLLSYAVGHFIQFHASQAQWDCFETTLRSVQEHPLRAAQKLSEESEQLDQSELGSFARAAIRISNISLSDLYRWCVSSVSSLLGRLGSLPFTFVFSSLLSPAYCWLYSPNGDTVDDTEISFKVFKDLVARYPTVRDTDDYDQLINIISSEIDDVSTPARSIRFQAIRNFHRAMWIVSWYSAIAISALYVFETNPDTQEVLTHIGITYRSPGLFSQWGPDWHLIIASVLLTIGFQRLARKFELQFTEYLFSDYLVSRQQSRDKKGWRDIEPDEAENGGS